RIREGDGHSCIERQLAFDADRRLNDVGRPQCWTNLLNSLRGLKGSQRSDRRNRREEIRICNYILLLNDSVVAQSGEPVRETEPIVENAEACTHDGLWTRILCRSWRPRNRQAWRK